MSTHETVIRDHSVEPGSDRGFGLTVGGILAAIGGYQWWAGIAWWPALLGFGGLLVVLGLALPRLLNPLNRAWTQLGLMLGRIVTPIVMFIVYCVSVVPIGLVMRLAGKDLLSLKIHSEASSYWIERTPPGPPPESLKDQF